MQVTTRGPHSCGSLRVEARLVRALTWLRRETDRRHPQPAAALPAAADDACESLQLGLAQTLFVAFAREEAVHVGVVGVHGSSFLVGCFDHKDGAASE